MADRPRRGPGRGDLSWIMCSPGVEERILSRVRKRSATRPSALMRCRVVADLCRVTERAELKFLNGLPWRRMLMASAVDQNEIITKKG
jgi:hypothetical protein